MKFLFCVLPERGHVNPYLGPALELRARGHRVALWAPRDIRPLPEGLEYVGSEEPAGAHRGREFAERIRDRAWLRDWIRRMLLDDAHVEPLRAVLRDFRADAVAIDNMCYSAAIASELERVPWAGLSSSLNPVVPDLKSELQETVRGLDRGPLFAKHGLRFEFRVCDVVSPWLNTVFATRAFTGTRELPAHTYLVGPSIPRGPRGDESDFPMEALRRPCVYLSLGSQISWQPEIFRRVLEAVRGRPVQLVASMGELLSTLERPPENLIAVRYAPQLRILPRADLLITHGGANSVMEALCFGVPILIHPICNDQPHQAWFLEECGVGRRVDLEKDDVWKAIESLLAPTSSARVLAQRVRKSYEASSGAIIAAGLIEHLGATGRPIVRKSDDWMQLTTAKLEDFLHEGIARP